MQVNVETTQGLERRLTVEVPAEEVDSKVKNRLAELAPTLKIPGFRPGKVPNSILQKRYGSAVRREIIGEIVETTFHDAVEQEKLKVAGHPKIEPTEMEPGKPLTYVATFEVFPEVEVSSLSGQSIEKLTAEINDKDLDDVIEGMRKQRTDWKKVERAAKEGDKVIIDFEGIIDGKPLEQGSSKDFSLELGSKSMIPGFEDGMIGHKAGDEFSLDLSFPKDYEKELAEKPVTFNVTVKEVQEAQLPEVNAELIKEFGVKSGKLEDFHVEVRKNMQRELERKLKNLLKQNIVEKLVELHPIDLPISLIEQEALNLQREMLGPYMQQLKPEQVQELLAKMPVDDKLKDKAKKRVQVGLVFAALLDEHTIKVDDDKIKKAIEEIAASYDDKQEVINYYYSDKQRLAEVESMVLEDQVIDMLTEQATIAEKPSTYKEVMETK